MSKVSHASPHDAHDLYAQEGVCLVILKRWRGWGVAAGRSEAKRVSQRKVKPDAALLLFFSCHPGNIREYGMV